MPESVRHSTKWAPCLSRTVCMDTTWAFSLFGLPKSTLSIKHVLSASMQAMPSLNPTNKNSLLSSVLGQMQLKFSKFLNLNSSYTGYP